jgi:hypothetical protein
MDAENVDIELEDGEEKRVRKSLFNWNVQLDD